MGVGGDGWGREGGGVSIAGSGTRRLSTLTYFMDFAWIP